MVSGRAQVKRMARPRGFARDTGRQLEGVVKAGRSSSVPQRVSINCDAATGSRIWKSDTNRLRATGHHQPSTIDTWESSRCC